MSTTTVERTTDQTGRILTWRELFEKRISVSPLNQAPTDADHWVGPKELGDLLDICETLDTYEA